MRKEIIEIEVTGTGEGISQVDKLDKSIKNVADTAKTSTKETEGLSKSAIDGAKNFRFMGVSINGVSKTLKVLKVSLIATGIGAIVVAVGALAAAFLSTQAGVDKLNSVLTPLKEVLATIWGIAQNLGKGLFQLVNGDISKGFDTMAKAVENVGDQMDIAWQRGKRLAELQIEIEERSVNQSLVISRQNRFLNEQLEIAEDLTKTDEERRKAFVNARASQELITKLKLVEKDAEIELAKLKVLANDTDREAQKDLNELIAQKEDIQAQGTKQQTLLLKKQNTVKQEGAEIKTGETFEEFEKRNEAIRKQIEADNQERERIAEQRRLDNETLQTHLNEEEQIEMDAEDRRLAQLQITQQEEIKTAKETADAKIKISELEARAKSDSLNSYAQALGAIGDLIGKETAAGKVASVASTLISTYLAAQQAYASQLTIPTPDAPIRAALAAGVAVASGLANVKAILAVKTPGGGGGASSAGSAPKAQSPSFNIVGKSSTNQLAESIGSQEKKPIKTYVVSKEMSNTQELDRNTENLATFG